MQDKNKNITDNQSTELGAPTGWRFRLGLFIFTLGWICPLFIPLLSYSNLSSKTVTLLSGFLLIGAPEIFSIISIVILGKPGFNYIKSKIFAFLKRAVPRSKVSRKRYQFGLFLMLLHVIYAYSTYYIPDLIPGYSEGYIAMNLTADFLFIVTLFILGGDFWEKLRSLVLYDAKACIPKQT